MLTAADRRPRAPGFSTMEILAGMGLTLILLAAVYTFQGAQLKALRTQNVYADSQNVTRTVIDLMSRELRMATYDPTLNTITPSPAGANCPNVKQGIIQATPTSIRFQQNLNGDGAIAGDGEDVTYTFAGGQITRTDGVNAPVTLVSNVPSNGFSLLYFSGNTPPVQLVPAGSPASLTQAQRDCVVSVRMTIQANIPNPNPNISTPIKSVAESEVVIRNRALLNL
jgi:hypothetical protein